MQSIDDHEEKRDILQDFAQKWTCADVAVAAGKNRDKADQKIRRHEFIKEKFIGILPEDQFLGNKCGDPQVNENFH